MTTSTVIMGTGAAVTLFAIAAGIAWLLIEAQSKNNDTG